MPDLHGYPPLPFLLFGLVFIAFGFLYLRQPTLYRRGIWMKTSIAIRLLSERNYIRYIRGLGVLFMILGACLIGLAALNLIAG